MPSYVCLYTTGSTGLLISNHKSLMTQLFFNYLLTVVAPCHPTIGHQNKQDLRGHLWYLLGFVASTLLHATIGCQKPTLLHLKYPFPLKSIFRIPWAKLFSTKSAPCDIFCLLLSTKDSVLFAHCVVCKSIPNFSFITFFFPAEHFSYHQRSKYIKANICL